MPYQPADLGPDQEALYEVLSHAEESCLDGPLDETSLDSWTECLRKACLESVMDLPGTIELLHIYRRDFEERLLPGRLQLAHYKTFDNALTNVIEFASLEFFLPELEPDLEVLPQAPHCTEAALKTLLQNEPYFPNPSLLPRYYQPVFVHLFSGCRRTADLQEQLEAIQWGPVLTPLVVSIDVMVNSSRCDLSKADQRAYWLAKAYNGQLDGGLSGPPCETWSSARHHELNGSRDPRPLRDNEQDGEALWGKDGLSLREGQQVFLGNTLLTFTLLMQLIMWARGKWFLTEHPKEPMQQDRASIWRLPFVRLLMRMPYVHRYLLWQGLYGGWSPKPTHVLVCHGGPNFAQLATQCQTTNMPKALVMGREDGSRFYSTAKLKEYPAALNYFFAASFKSWIDAAPSADVTQALPPEDLAILQSLVVTPEASSTIFGPDFAG